MSWTDERVALLKKLWGEGKTAAEIAKTLGGVTRNAVIGKAHRLKLSNRLSPIQQNKKPARQPVAANTSVPVEKKTASAKTTVSVTASAKPAPVTDGKKLNDLGPRECRWPHGDPREENFGFCGDRVVAGLPYCLEHAKVAYQAATRNKILKAEDFEEKAAKDDLQDLKSAVGA